MESAASSLNNFAIDSATQARAVLTRSQIAPEARLISNLHSAHRRTAVYLFFADEAFFRKPSLYCAHQRGVLFFLAHLVVPESVRYCRNLFVGQIVEVIDQPVDFLFKLGCVRLAGPPALAARMRSTSAMNGRCASASILGMGRRLMNIGLYS